MQCSTISVTYIVFSSVPEKKNCKYNQLSSTSEELSVSGHGALVISRKCFSSNLIAELNGTISFRRLSCTVLSTFPTGRFTWYGRIEKVDIVWSSFVALLYKHCLSKKMTSEEFVCVNLMVYMNPAIHIWTHLVDSLIINGGWGQKWHIKKIPHPDLSFELFL